MPFLIYGADLQLNHSYPKVANLFFRWDISTSEAKELAKWDILIIDMEVQRITPDSLKLIKQYNPNIKILAYLASADIRGDSGSLSGSLRQKLYRKINSNWWLRDTSGRKVEWWQGNPLINPTDYTRTASGSRWYDELPKFVKNELVDSGYWDGVFYDNVWDDVSFLSQKFQIDIDNDGRSDSNSKISSAWKIGMTKLLQNTRNLLGNDKLILTNGGEGYYQYINGTLFEHFPDYGWDQTLLRYKNILDRGAEPAIGIINSNVDNSGDQDNYQKMRYGLASALLQNGYYSFDSGDQSHHEIWWYDEYEAALGEPAGEAEYVLGSGNQLREGLWRRDFTNGLVLVNSTGRSYTIDLGAEYEKIRGTQDPRINDGTFVSRVTIPAKDGLILLRSIGKITNAAYFNGSFARIYNQYGNVARAGFFAYNEMFQGGNQVIEQDLDYDGKNEFVVADDTKVQIFNYKGNLLNTFYPYERHYNKGINISVGDLDNNGTMEIVTGTERGGGPHIRVFNHRGKLINPGFFAYAKNFRGGVNVSIGDLEGDGYLEIIAGAGYGGGPHVRVFAADGRLINPGFFAYDERFRGGVNVAVADIDGDGVDEIVTGPGKGGGPQVRSFNRHGQIDGPEFFAFDSSQRGGVEVAASDLDGDGKAEIIATTRDVFTLAGF